MKVKRIVFNLAFGLNILLLFLLAFENYLEVPSILQVFGRMHPLFLHIPIGIFILYAAFELFVSSRSHEVITDLRDGLLLISALALTLTALMGIFLSKEAGYEGNNLLLHKYGGVLASVLVLAWYQWRNNIRKNSLTNKLVAVAGIAIITITGHFGGNITHGENFVLGPVLPANEKVDVAFEDAIVYEHVIHPILDAKCVSCHNERKAKGELIMESAEMLLKGGKNGKLWDTTAADLGTLLQRVHLPLSDEEHMPPKGKPQLTDLELEILEAWIKSGSDFKVKVVDLPKEDPLFLLASEVLKPSNEESYQFAAADQDDVNALNSFYRIVKPIAENSPALAVSFFGAGAFKADNISELTQVKEQVVEMDLSRMPLKDQDLKLVGEFPNLRKLILNFTPIEGSGLNHLSKLKSLKEISLSGTKVEASRLAILETFPELQKVFLWNTGITPDVAMQLAKKTGTDIESGYNNDTLMLKLPPPAVQHESFVLSSPVNLKLKHNINGAIIRFTTDGTEPDSISSAIYKGDFRIDKNVTIKAKVFREGWVSSDVQTARFFMSGLKPDRVKLITAPNPKYTGNKEKTLFDLSFGGNNFGNGNWLGFQAPSKLDVLLSFDKVSTASSVTLSGQHALGAHIFPPASVTIWYGIDSTNLTKLPSKLTKMPAKDQPTEAISYQFDLPGVPFKFIRIEAVPFAKLPPWHGSKGKPAWVFVDEIIIN